MINECLSQAKKDWLEFRRDRLSLALAFLLPLVSLFLFGYGIRLESKHVPATIVDDDHSALSRSFARRLFATETFVPTKTPNDPDKALLLGDARALIDIPIGFEANIERGRAVDVLFTIDGTALTEANATKAIAQAFGTVFSTYVKPPDPKLFYVLPKITTWFNPGLKESLFTVGGVFAVVLWMFPSLLAAVSMSRDLEHGSIVQAFSANLNPTAFLFGKTAVYAGVGICQALLVVSVGCAVFGLQFVEIPIQFVVCTAVYIVIAVLFGTFLGLIAKSQTAAVQATSSGGFFPCLLLSGFVYPLSNIPFPLSLVSYLVPARYYIEISRDTFMRGTGWEVFVQDSLPLACFAVGLFGICWLLLKDMRLKD